MKISTTERRELGNGGPLFINLLPAAIYNPEHCLRTTAELIAENGMEPSRAGVRLMQGYYFASPSERPFSPFGEKCPGRPEGIDALNCRKPRPQRRFL